MHGFLNINKPQGLTSFDIIKKLKKHLPGVKLGHLGTLDPMATGVLPVAVGYATRLIEYIPEETKTYSATMTLGGISDTQDAWGEITYTGITSFNDKILYAVVDSYTGSISQIPPMYSAVHHEGHRLYELARKGISVDREPRAVEIKSIKIEEISQNERGLPLIKLCVDCSKGTYVRTLCHDIGSSLGTGAFMSELIRTRSGIFTIEKSHDLDIILNSLENHLLPLDYPLETLPEVELTNQTQYNSILNGNFININYKLPLELIRVYYGKNLISIARSVDQDTGVMLKPLKVFK